MQSRRLAAFGLAVFTSLVTMSTAALPTYAKNAEFDAFYVKFCVALKAKNKESIASMTRLPYYSQIKDKNMNKAEFIQNFENIFPKSARACLVKIKPVQDGVNFCACCGDDIYYFEKVNGKFVFTEVGVND